VGKAHDQRPLRSSQAWLGRATERLARRLQFNTLIDVKVDEGLKPDGGPRMSVSSTMSGLSWAINNITVEGRHDVSVINMSFGGP